MAIVKNYRPAMKAKQGKKKFHLLFKVCIYVVVGLCFQSLFT